MKRLYHKSNVMIYILIIIIIIAIIKIFENFSVATNKFKEEIITENNKQEESFIENIIVGGKDQQEENIIERKVAEEKTSKDTDALSKINTRIRKTASGKKYTSIGFINIPSLNIKYEILSSYSEELLKISVNKYWGANPNEVGNMCILGHNYKNSKFFGNLPKIKKGDKIYITDLEGETLTYKVYETDIISEEDLSCTSQKTNGKIEVTLITCYYMTGDRHASKRFIAKARAE